MDSRTLWTFALICCCLQTGCEAPPLVPIAQLPNSRLIVDDRGRLRDALGREVVMRGLNTGGRSKFEPFLPFEIESDATLDEVRGAADRYFARLRGWGLDTARMPFSWEALEPSPGEIDEEYLLRYETMVDSAWALGIRVIVDFHQDVYTSPFCGDGFPPWTVSDLASGPPRHDCEDWFMAYLGNDELEMAFDRFWSDEEGTQTAFREMWLLMADRFAHHPGVIGFEFINEPSIGSADDALLWKRDVLAPFYSSLAEEIHVIAPDQLIFYDNAGTDSVFPADAIHFRPEGDAMVFAPHYYDWSILFGGDWSGTLPEAQIAGLAELGADAGVPILLGEFGYPNGTPDGGLWLNMVMNAADSHRISTTLWEYSQSPELWNHEDLSVIDSDGSEREILDVYVRPWLRAVAGSDSTFTWDREADQVRASWTAEDGITEIIVPRRLFPSGPQNISIEGDGAVFTWDSDRGELRVAATTGASVVVRFSGSSR